MGRLLCIDYGRKRSGVAVTDPLKICANGLPTVRTCDLLDFIINYTGKEEVEAIIIGEPKDMKGNPSESARFINPFIARLSKALPSLKIIRHDERFTSSIAHREMITAGMSRSQRQEKERADQMAAVLILTSYLESRQFNLDCNNPT